MSTFSGLTTALSSLHTQRQALEVAGQNIANANTVGYTRQRADITSVESPSSPSLSSGGLAPGTGTAVDDITRIGDVFLDARLRAETGGAAASATLGETYLRLESTVAEPGDQGIAHSLDQFWASWDELGNSPSSQAARAVVLEEANALAGRISSGYAAVRTHWDQARTELDAVVVDVNSTATMVAGLNERIREVLGSGGSANELVDQRDVLVMKLAGAVGARAVERRDGTVDVMVSGNALVRGDRAHTIIADSGSTMGSAVTIRWAQSGTAVGPVAGRVAGLVTTLAPAADGGILSGAGASYDDLAATLITRVNAHHAVSMTPGDPQAPGGPFFATTPVGFSAAEKLAVAITDRDAIAVARPGAGPLDGSMADEMSALGTAADGPDAQWSTFVVDLGVRSRSATQRADMAESVRSGAERLQLSGASVDIDEESVSMLAYQRAYEGAARVLTAVDEMLDTLINRTGVVGR